MEAYRAIAYRRDSFSAKLRRHGIPDTAVYGKGVRFVLRGPARTGACVCPPSPPACEACAPEGQGTPHDSQVPAEQFLCCRVYRVLALSSILQLRRL